MLSEADLKALSEAKRLLERPNVMLRTLNRLGVPVEMGIKMLPAPVAQRVAAISRHALTRSLRAALMTLDGRQRLKPPRRLAHKGAVILSGGIGGVFGLPALAIELPISTTIMFRAIADLARSFGEDLEHPETLVQCLQVFALGGRSSSDDAAENAYFVVRAAMADQVSRASVYLAKTAGTDAARTSAPVVARFIETVAARFGVVVSEKVAAAAVPAIGALGGATVNAIFMDHYQKVAWGHFQVRSLERLYGNEAVLDAWQTQVARE